MIYASPTPFLWGSYLSQPGICLTAQQVCPKKSGSDRHSEKTMILQSFSSRILEKEWNSSFSLPFINSVKHTRARVRYHANWQSAQFIVTNKVSLSNFEAIITVGRKLAGIFPASSTSLNMFFFFSGFFFVFWHERQKSGDAQVLHIVCIKEFFSSQSGIADWETP